MVPQISPVSSYIGPHFDNEYDQASKDVDFVATLKKYVEAGSTPKEMADAKDWYNHIYHACKRWESEGSGKAKDAFIEYYDPFNADVPLSQDQQRLERHRGKGPRMAEDRQTDPVYQTVRSHRLRYKSISEQLQAQLNNNQPISTEQLCNFAANTSVDDSLQAAHVMRDSLRPVSGDQSELTPSAA